MEGPVRAPRPRPSSVVGRLSGAVGTASIVLVVLAGCSAGGSARAGAETTAEQFAQAVSAGHGAGACALLTRDAREDVETASGVACATGIGRLRLAVPSADAPDDARVYGRAAVVGRDGAALFLARSGSTWLVRAAGCAPRTDAPYDCTVDGS